MKLLLCEANLKQGTRDSWHWLLNPESTYSVSSSAYRFLLDSLLGEDSSIFKSIWSCAVPSNIRAFTECSFKHSVLIDCLRSKANLQRRNVIQNGFDVHGSFCCLEDETTDHLL